MRNTGLEETSWNQDCWEKYQSPQICRWHHPYGRKWRGTQNPLDESERGDRKSWLKIMASGPFTSWEIDGESVETVSDFIFWGSKIISDCDCSHEIKRRLLLWRQFMTNLDSILKSREITLPKKVHLVMVMVLPVVMYGCELDCGESWAPKNWCFWTVMLEKTLDSPWTAR